MYVGTYVPTCVHTCVRANMQTDGRTDGLTYVSTWQKDCSSLALLDSIMTHNTCSHPDSKVGWAGNRPNPCIFGSPAQLGKKDMAMRTIGSSKGRSGEC